MKEKLLSIITELSGVKEIEWDESLERVGINSLKTVELMIAIEDAFSVTFNDSELDVNILRTPNQIAEFLQRYI